MILKKKMIQEINLYGDYNFKKDISRFLLNPDTKNSEILFHVGPYSNILL